MLPPENNQIQKLSKYKLKVHRIMEIVFEGFKVDLSLINALSLECHIL